MILIRRGLTYKLCAQIKDPNGRFVISELEVDGSQFVLCNVYAPNLDSPNFFVRMRKEIESLNNRNVIVGGDFNFVINNEIDRLFSHCNNDKARDEFLNFAQECELTDCWRFFNPDKRQYSCCRPNSDENNWQKFSRLDMIFISDGLLNQVSSCKMQTGFQSDHSFVIVDINVAGSKRGPGYWKFNTSYLYDKNYVDTLNALLEEHNNNNEQVNPEVKWETAKGVITQFSKQYGRDKAAEKNKKLDQIEEQLDKLKDFIEATPFTEYDALDNLKLLEKERKEILAYKVKGIQMRCKEKYYSEGERSSKYYFSLEKHNQSKKVITRIRKQNQIITQNQNEILSEQQRFYERLFRSNQEVAFNIQNTCSKTITEEEKNY